VGGGDQDEQRHGREGKSFHRFLWVGKVSCQAMLDGLVTVYQ
jgi:hypothetical protein